MKRLARGTPFGGPMAVVNDMLLLLLAFVITLLLMKPEPPTHVIVAEHHITDGAPMAEPPLALIRMSTDGIRIDRADALLTLDEASVHLAALAEMPGKVLVCVIGVPFDQHWAVRDMLAETLAREPFFIPCKEDTR